MTEEVGLPTDLQDIAPTARLIYLLLEHVDRPLRPVDIAQRTRTPERTVHHALHALRTEGLVETVDAPDGDASGRGYRLADHS